MAMKRCPVCGEKYSDTYKECPFCEEERELQELQEGGGRARKSARGGRRTAARSRQFSLITPTLIVLIILMAALLVYLLWGSQLAERFSGQDDPGTEDVVPGGDASGDEDPNGTMPSGTDETDNPDDTQTDDTEGTDSTDDTQDDTTEPADTTNTTDYEEAMALPDGLTLSTTDFTLQNLGESATIRVTAGGSGSYTWISEDDGVAAVSSSGKVTAVSGGTVNVVVTDGTRKGVCIVRVRATGSLPSAPADSDSGSGGSHTLNNTDFTRSVSEGSYQLRVSGVTTGITWTSSDTSVATVSSTGLVTPVGAGTATVTASWDGQSLSCIVRVPG